MNGLGSEEDMHAFFAFSIHGGPEAGVDARHLSKVWWISYEDAKRTINATTQHGMHNTNPVMNQKYTTNDWMLQYRRITEYFFHGYFLCHKQWWNLVKGEHMLSIICNRQTVYIRCADEMKI